MDSFELNKYAGAVLGTLLFVVALNVLSGALFTPKKPAVPGYEIAIPAEESAPGAPAPAASEPLPVLLAKADPAKGQAAARKCAACHTFEKGGPNRIGPNLYGIVGRPVASHPGFAYSAALKAHGGEWTYQELDEFIHNPRQDVPGTIMTFAGIPSQTEIADVLAYLRTLSDNPVPLPTP